MSNIVFFTYGSTLELNGEQFEAGRLTEELLNLSPECYHPLHDRMERITSLEERYDREEDIAVLWELNEEMVALCQEMRAYKVFSMIIDQEEDQYFSVIRELTQQYSLFPQEKRRPVSDEEIERALEAASAFKREHTPPEEEEEFFDLFGPPTDDDGNFDYAFRRSVGITTETWTQYRGTITRYRSYLHDLRAFIPTIRHFIKFFLSKLKENTPENYAEMLYGFYYDRRTADKLIVNPIYYNGDCYRVMDNCSVSYVPRELPNGRFVIAQAHMTDSLQALMKADFMLALNCGHNIRRCLICEKYFLVKGGHHTLYCEGTCPHDKRYTCRMYGTVDVQKELAKDVPKIRIKLQAFERIQQDKRRGVITEDECRRAKDYVRDQLYEALHEHDLSVDTFAEQVSSESVYRACDITRKTKPRGRPPKKKAGETP